MKALGLPDLKAILKGEKTIQINPIDTAEQNAAFPVVPRTLDGWSFVCSEMPKEGR